MDGTSTYQSLGEPARGWEPALTADFGSPAAWLYMELLPAGPVEL
jgi:hypothetical protein